MMLLRLFCLGQLMDYTWMKMVHLRMLCMNVRFTTVLQILFGFCYLLVFSMMLGIFFGFGLSYLFKIN